MEVLTFQHISHSFECGCSDYQQFFQCIQALLNHLQRNISFPNHIIHWHLIHYFKKSSSIAVLTVISSHMPPAHLLNLKFSSCPDRCYQSLANPRPEAEQTVNLTFTFVCIKKYVNNILCSQLQQFQNSVSHWSQT